MQPSGPIIKGQLIKKKYIATIHNLRCQILKKLDFFLPVPKQPRYTILDQFPTTTASHDHHKHNHENPGHKVRGRCGNGVWGGGCAGEIFSTGKTTVGRLRRWLKLLPLSSMWFHYFNGVSIFVFVFCFFFCGFWLLGFFLLFSFCHFLFCFWFQVDCV